MNNEGGKRQFEHLLSLLVIAAAVIVLFVFVNRVSAPAERVRVQYTLSGLRSAVQVKELTALVTGGSLAGRAGTNPVDLMEVPPAAYAGLYAEGRKPRPGRWYFDAGAGELVYVIINRENFNAARELRFRLEYVPEARKATGRLRLVGITEGENKEEGR